MGGSTVSHKPRSWASWTWTIVIVVVVVVVVVVVAGTATMDASTSLTTCNSADLCLFSRILNKVTLVT